MKENLLKLIVYFVLFLAAIFIYYVNNQVFTNKTLNNNVPTEIIYEKYHKQGKSNSLPLLLAHRGSRYLLPENTLHAFKTALDIGADVIETDTRLTIDGTLVLFHDKSVDRTTDGGNKNVEDLTLQEIKSLDAAYKFTPDNGTSYPYRGKGIKVPTVEEMLRELPEDTQFNIEIKEDSTVVAELLWKEIEHSIETTLRKPRSILIGCRYCDPTRRIRELAKQYQIKNNVDQLPITTSACEKDVTKFVILNKLFLDKIYFNWINTQPLGYECFQVPPVSGPIRLDHLQFLNLAHSYNKHVHYWVVNFKDEIEHLLNLPVDGIISDRSDTIVSIYNNQSSSRRQHPPHVIPKPLPGNSTGTYYLPTFDIIEDHTCVTITCFLLQRIHQIIISLIFSFLFLKLYLFKNRNQLHQPQQQKSKKTTPAVINSKKTK